MDLKYPGLTQEEISLLRETAKAQHPRGGMQTCMGCACGHGAGGPAGTPLCRILRTLEDAGREARLERLPRRDPSVCNHEVGGQLRIYEAFGKTLCEQCGSEV